MENYSPFDNFNHKENEHEPDSQRTGTYLESTTVDEINLILGLDGGEEFNPVVPAEADREPARKPVRQRHGWLYGMLRSTGLLR